MPGLVLVAGGSGHLGTRLVNRLLEADCRVRVLTRDPARASHLEGDRVEIVEGDLRDPAGAARATEGVDIVISAIQGMDTAGGGTPRTVDAEGNANLMAAARAAGVNHFVMVSVLGASPDHPMELFRMKFQAEQELQRSGLNWTIVRSGPFMEFWAGLVCAPLLTTGKTQVYGRGRNPINFVAMDDVAGLVVRAAGDPLFHGQLINLGGPENLTVVDLIKTFQRVTGTTGKASHLPLPVLRIARVATRPINPRMSRLIGAAIAMDTEDMSGQPSKYAPTRMEEVIRREYGDVSGSAAPPRAPAP